VSGPERARPDVAPDVLAALTSAVPARVAKRLDASPRAADAWVWTFGESVTVAAGEETVTLTSGTVRRQEDATCTCLLQPRCFHLLAVLAVLPLAEEPAAEAELAGPEVDGPLRTPTSVTSSTPPAPSSPEDALTPRQLATAEEALEVGARILADGLSRVSTLRMGELVRVVHSCRRDALFRLESAALGVFESARDAREGSPDFRLHEAATRLAELLLVALRLTEDARSGRGVGEWRGLARRAYREVGSLRLAGLGCEPVLSKGYSGVVTYFTDGERVFSAQEVMPGDADRALHAYDAQLRFGEVSLSHREAAHAGLLFANARVSPEGRLGAGADAVCVSAARDPGLVERLFAEPLGAQLERADRGERQGLLFASGTMGLSTSAAARLVLDEHRGSLPLTLPIDEPRFAYRENVERLTRAGAHLRLVGRLAPDGSAVDPIAIQLDDGRWFSLAYDRLAGRDIEERGPATPLGEDPRARPAALDPARRRMLRFALAGAQSLPSAALPELARETTRLRASLLGTCGDLLEHLAKCARSEARATARAWLALHTYLRAADRTLGSPPPPEGGAPHEGSRRVRACSSGDRAGSSAPGPTSRPRDTALTVKRVGPTTNMR